MESQRLESNFNRINETYLNKMVNVLSYMRLSNHVPIDYHEILSKTITFVPSVLVAHN